MINPISIGIVDYEKCMQSALFGLEELFMVANRVAGQAAKTEQSERRWPEFDARRTRLSDLHNLDAPSFDVLVFPPSLSERQPAELSAALRNAVCRLHANGCVMASACAGAFCLASAGLLEKRKVTTHWALAQGLSQRHPGLNVDASQILIDDGDVITSGGLMAWMDLGMHIIQRFAGPALVMRLSKYFLIDTGSREQRYYQRFQPELSHGDSDILSLQHWLQQHFDQPLNNQVLADRLHTTPRTLQRRFQRATGLSPSVYIQQLRIQKARDLLETTQLAVEQIIWQVGYEDASAFRKRFKQWVGLTAGEYRQRFHQQPLDDLPRTQTQVPHLPDLP